jgi:hypothetical protein
VKAETNKNIWPEAVTELSIDKLSGGCVSFGDREKSFEYFEFSKTDWLKIGAPTTIKVAIYK